MKRKTILQTIIKQHPSARKVSKKYQVLREMVCRMYPNSFQKIRTSLWEDIIFDVVNADRDLRKLNEGFDTEEKTRLEAEYLKTI